MLMLGAYRSELRWDHVRLARKPHGAGGSEGMPGEGDRMGRNTVPEHRASGPTFERPPITELAIGIQFRTIAGIRAINLAPLRARWQSEYPAIEELPALM